MSLIHQYRDTETQIKELQEHLASMKNDEGLQKEMEFEAKLRALMGEYSKSLRDVIAILDPSHKTSSSKKADAPKATRTPRAIKVYKNPHTGEVIETKGGNHKGLNEWKTKYGREEVISWAS